MRFYLPLPVSVNAMYKVGRGRKFISQQYARWIDKADIWMASQDVTRPKRPINKPVELAIIAYRGKGWVERTRDLDNMIKAVQDYLVRGEWLADDNSEIVRRVSVELSGEMKREACVGVRINDFIPGTSS